MGGKRLTRAMLVVLALLACGKVAANHYILPCPEPCRAAQWYAAGELGTPRELHTATVLPDGRVLIAGGRDAGGGALASAELYDPIDGSWTAAAPMSVARAMHIAAALPDGRVLVAGGSTGGGDPPVTDSAELYDPATNAWTPTARMSAPRFWYAAASLANGRVLVVGGWSGGTALATAEHYDPDSGLWTRAAPMAKARYGHTLTALPDGTVLAVRGSDSGDLEYSFGDAERYDPVTDSWSDAGSAGEASVLHEAVALQDGRVLVTGGYEGGVGGGPAHASAHLFDPVSGAWTRIGAMSTPRYRHAMSLLPDGTVLVAGGVDILAMLSCSRYINLAASDVLDPVALTWTVAPALREARSGATLTLLADGTALAAGGLTVGPGCRSLMVEGAELYLAPSARKAAPID